jgi:hypothetical protein
LVKFEKLKSQPTKSYAFNFFLNVNSENFFHITEIEFDLMNSEILYQKLVSIHSDYRSKLIEYKKAKADKKSYANLRSEAIKLKQDFHKIKTEFNLTVINEGTASLYPDIILELGDWEIKQFPTPNTEPIEGLQERNGAFLTAIQSMLETVLKNTGDAKKNRPSHNEIKPFSGEHIKAYQTFKATFESIIGKSQLSKVEKLTHLRAKSTKQALELIDHLQLIDQNYDRAWDLLKGYE